MSKLCSDIIRSRLSGSRRPASGPRRGIVCVLAMLFLILFAVLAIGFCGATLMSAQVSANERAVQTSQTSAESGLTFIRYQMSAITQPPGTTDANLLANFASRLAAELNGTANMGTNKVTVAGGSISIPSQTGWVTIDPASNGKFRVVITQSGNRLVATARGWAPGGATRGGQLQFQPGPRPYSLVGINSLTLGGSAYTDSYDASKGTYAAASAKTFGSVASNGNITLNNTANVKGDVRYGTSGTATIAPAAVVSGTVAPMLKSVTYASVTLPPAGTYVDLGDVTQSSGTMTIPGGTYLINKLTLSNTAKVVWSGPVKLYIKTSYAVSGSVSISTHNNLPVNRQIFFLPTCKTATWSGTNVCVGDLYAPDTDFTIGGSVQKMGRVIAKSISNTSSGGMHYDESLPAPNGQAVYVPVPGTYLEVP